MSISRIAQQSYWKPYTNKTHSGCSSYHTKVVKTPSSPTFWLDWIGLKSGLCAGYIIHLVVIVREHRYRCCWILKIYGFILIFCYSCLPTMWILLKIIWWVRPQEKIITFIFDEIIIELKLMRKKFSVKILLVKNVSCYHLRNLGNLWNFSHSIFFFGFY